MILTFTLAVVLGMMYIWEWRTDEPPRLMGKVPLDLPFSPSTSVRIDPGPEYIHNVPIHGSAWNLLDSLADRGYYLPYGAVRIFGGKGPVRDWDRPLTFGEEGDVTMDGTIFVRLFLGRGGMQSYNLRSRGRGTEGGRGNNPRGRGRPRGGASGGAPERTREQEIQALNFNADQMQYVLNLQNVTDTIQNQFQDLRKQIEAQTQEIDSLRANQSDPSPPMAVAPLTRPDTDLDTLKATADQTTTLANISAWVEAIAAAGQYALGFYFPTILGRIDYPVFLSFDWAKFQRINPTMRRDQIAGYIHTHKLGLPTAQQLREYYHKRQPQIPPPPPQFPPPPRPPGNLFSRPFSPYSTLPPTAPVPAMSQQAYLLNEIKSLKAQLAKTQSQMTTLAGGANSQLHGRSLMMGATAPNPLLMDPTNIYNPISTVNAKEQLDSFLIGKTQLNISLSTLRRIVAPGCSTFNPKDGGHIDEIVKGLIWRVTELYKEGKIDDARYETLKGELQQCSSNFAKIKNDEMRRRCCEAWQRGLVNQRSFVGIEFMSMAVASVHFGSRGNGPRPQYGDTKGGRCNLCRQSGHWRRECPYKSGRLLPKDLICEAYQSKACNNQKCNKAHVCMRCRSVYITHPVQDCTRES